MQTAVSFGTWLKERRREHDLRQEELAERVGCSLAALQKLESGERRPSRQLALLLARALAVPPDEHQLFIRFARQRDEQPLAQVDNLNTKAPWRSQYAAVTNVPALPGRLFGRETLLQTLAEQFAQKAARLVTLHGPPGVGKTSLAVALAHTQLGYFDDGVFFVELAGVHAAGEVMLAFLRALRIHQEGGQSPFERVQQYLQGRNVLLVLDNFEHVVAASGEVAALLASCPWLKLLVTSRVALQVRGERRVLVEPLRTPPVARMPGGKRRLAANVLEYDAVQMFVEHAYGDTAFQRLDDACLQSIGEICAHLDGLPLAIELAASHCVALAPADILHKLRKHQFLLTSELADLPERHQTLSRAIETSYCLLLPQAQWMLQVLSVFRAPATEAAIMSIMSMARGDGDLPAECVADVLKRLVMYNFVTLHSADGSTPRYAMLEPLREDAARRLAHSGRENAVFEHFALYHRHLAVEAASGLYGADERQWLEQLDHEFPNFEAAMTWLLAHEQPEPAGVIAASLWRFWTARGWYTIGIRWLERVLEQGASVGPKCLADVNLVLAELISHLGEEQRARTLLAECADLYTQLDDEIGMAFTRWVWHWRLRLAGDLEAAEIQLNKALYLFRKRQHVWGLAAVSGELGSLAMSYRQQNRAAYFFDVSLDLAQSIANPSLLAICYNNLAWLARERGDLARAEQLIIRCIELARTLRNRSLEAVQLYCQALVLARSGKLHESQAIVEQCIAAFDALADRLWLAHSNTLYGDILWLRGLPAHAAPIIHEARRLYTTFGDLQGTAATLQSLGLIHAAQRQFDAAQSCFFESLQLANSTTGGDHNAAHALLCLAYLALLTGQRSLARTLLTVTTIILQCYGGQIEPYLFELYAMVQRETEQQLPQFYAMSEPLMQEQVKNALRQRHLHDVIWQMWTQA